MNQGRKHILAWMRSAQYCLLRPGVPLIVHEQYSRGRYVPPRIENSLMSARRRRARPGPHTSPSSSAARRGETSGTRVRVRLEASDLPQPLSSQSNCYSDNPALWTHRDEPGLSTQYSGLGAQDSELRTQDISDGRGWNANANSHTCMMATDTYSEAAVYRTPRTAYPIPHAISEYHIPSTPCHIPSTAYPHTARQCIPRIVEGRSTVRRSPFAVYSCQPSANYRLGLGFVSYPAGYGYGHGTRTAGHEPPGHEHCRVSTSRCSLFALGRAGPYGHGSLRIRIRAPGSRSAFGVPCLQAWIDLKLEVLGTAP
ncbi:hypothetical protein C8Q80DRAFT_605392 [Daedaleopsis nitida]|nr:hypothetical protein C8Q80DRAFT_605392 [Daedaleopsis nitida]